MHRSLSKIVWYDCVRFVCRVFALAAYRIRCRGQENMPAQGGAIVLSNHQSHLDPVLIGVACERRLSFLARKTLFHIAPLRWIIQSLDTIPIDREGSGLAGLRETLKRLREGEPVLIFPEGTRTLDGEIAPLKRGFCALAQRAKVPLVPVAIEGAFAAWPRDRRFPRPGRVAVVFGPPLEPAAYSDDELVAEVTRRIAVCHQDAKKLAGR